MARPRNLIPTVTMSLRIPEPVAVVLARQAAKEGLSRNGLASRSLTALAVAGRAEWPLPPAPPLNEEPQP